MKKTLKSIAAIAFLCAMCFLGGVWPEKTPMKKVLAYDGGAFSVMLVSGLYLKKTEEK